MRVQSPIAGNMTGSAGNIIFQHYNGRTYGRAKPVLFHYGPTPAQAVAQSKYYGIRLPFLNVYNQIKPFIPSAQLKQSNAYNDLFDMMCKLLNVFGDASDFTPPRKFGFDTLNRLSLRLGNWTLYYQAPLYYITFYDFDFASSVDFAPTYAHALYFCRDLKQMQYVQVDFNAEHLTFYFNNAQNWFPDYDFDMYVALSDEQYFSNFFY